MLFRVLLAAFLVILVLMGTISSIPVCGAGCTPAKHYSECRFRHVSELKDSSIATWSLETMQSEDLLKDFEVAKCNSCGMKDMVAKAITIEVTVFRRARNGSEHGWCECPYELPVGCTCVKKL